MQSSETASSKNFILARETAHFRNSIVIPLTESHRYLQSMGGEYVAKANSVIAMASTLDAIAGDNKAADFIKDNSRLSFSDKEWMNVKKVFPRTSFDVADIEVIFYDVIEAVENLISVLADFFSKGKEQLKKVMIILNDFVSKLKKTVTDTALKVYMLTKIEMIMRSQQASIRAA